MVRRPFPPKGFDLRALAAVGCAGQGEELE